MDKFTQMWDDCKDPFSQRCLSSGSTNVVNQMRLIEGTKYRNYNRKCRPNPVPPKAKNSDYVLKYTKTLIRLQTKLQEKQQNEKNQHN